MVAPSCAKDKQQREGNSEVDQSKTSSGLDGESTNSEGKADLSQYLFRGGERSVTLEKIMAGEVGRYITLTSYPSLCIKRTDLRD